jgi:hypothetical protein
MASSKKIQGLLLACVAWFFSSVLIAQAADASFYLSPTTGEYSIGDEFPIGIYVDTGGDRVSVVSGKIDFNKESLEVVDVTQEQSIVSWWTQDLNPLESDVSQMNLDGTISFEGFISEGYLGSDGNVITVIFRARGRDDARVTFNTGSAILAADEKATNVLTQMKSGKYTLAAEEIVPTVETISTTSPATSTLVSLTHPDQEMWYATTTAIFSWKPSETVTATRLLFDQDPDAAPTIFYAEALSEKTIKDIEEGEWYFHMQMQEGGVWQEAEHYRVGVDVTPPQYLEITEQERLSPTDPNPVYEFASYDAVSGVRGYELTIDDEPVGAIVTASTTSTSTVYRLKDVAPGKHVLTVRAIDRAGNSIEKKVDLVVTAIAVPTITNYEEEVIEGGVMVIEGTALPSAKVIVSRTKDGGEPQETSVLADAEGKFTYVLGENTAEGSYGFWVRAQDEFGAESANSEQILITVRKSGFVIYGGIIVSYLMVIVPLVGLALLLILILWYAWYMFGKYKRRLRKEVDEAEDVLHKEFADLRKVTQREIASLERASSQRNLTPEEQNIIRKLKGSVTAAEEAVDKEFEDVKNISVDHDESHEDVEISHLDTPQPQTKPQRTSSQNKMQLKIEKLR